jgi:hypothetical protein
MQINKRKLEEQDPEGSPSEKKQMRSRPPTLQELWGQVAKGLFNSPKIARMLRLAASFSNYGT